MRIMIKKSGKTTFTAHILAIGAIAALVIVSLAGTGAAVTEMIYSDDFKNTLTWTTSDNSVYIKDNDFLYIGTNGKYDDWAEKTFSIDLSKDYNIIIEQRIKLESGGQGYRLPWQFIVFEDNSNIGITNLPNYQSPWGWGNSGLGSPIGWTVVGNNEVSGSDYWAVTRTVITHSGGELYLKPDDSAKGWFSNDFSKVATASWSHSRISKIRFWQPWDSVNYIDYVKIYKSDEQSISTTAPTPTLSNSGRGSWSNYRYITVGENSGSTLTAYQVLVQLSGSNFPTSARSDGADIRFTEANGNELSYWIESWDYAGRSAKVWVKVPSVPARTTLTIHMYYGNPSASSSSNGNTVFPLFDDFEYNDYLTNGFIVKTIQYTGYCSKSQQLNLPSSKIFTDLSESTLGWDCDENRIVTEASSKALKLVVTRGGQLHNTQVITADLSASLGNSNQYRYRARERTVYVTTESAGLIIRNAKGRSEVLMVNDPSYAIRESGELPSNEGSWYAGLGVWDGGIGDGEVEELWVDWVLLRKYVSPEPTVTFGAEQPVSSATPITPAPTTYAPQPTTQATQPATSTLKQPLLTVAQTSLKEEPEVGEEALITVTVLNNGDATAKNIRLTEQLPSSISVSYIDGATSNTGNLVTWNGELAPNRAHAITHTLKILETKSRAIPVIIRYEDEQGNPKESSTTIYVSAQATATPTPVQTRASEPTVQEVKVKTPGFTGLLVLIGLIAAIGLARRR